jgi:hypothetical protein
MEGKEFHWQAESEAAVCNEDTYLVPILRHNFTEH